MTELVMRLKNGDELHSGDYGLSVNGDTIGPIAVWDGGRGIFHSVGSHSSGLWRIDGSAYYKGKSDSPKIIARAPNSNEVTAPVMTLPDGTTLRERDWAMLRNGNVVGPLTYDYGGGNDRRSYVWDIGDVSYNRYGEEWNDRESDRDITARAKNPFTETSHQTAPAVDYNDGEFHIWKGGECPVHPKSKVRGFEKNGTTWLAYAKDNDWPSFRGVFCVTSPYVEPAKPREYWILGGCEAYDSEQEATDACSSLMHPSIVHVREVTE